MSESQSFTKSFFKGIWNGINFTRRLVLNILFLIILVVVIFGLANSGSDEPNVAKNSALVLNLQGNLVIQKTWVDPAEQFISKATGQGGNPPEILVRDLIEVIENAKEDNRIQAIVLKLDGFGGGGMDKLIEVGEALESFKESGKKIFAIGDSYGRSQYMLASHADNVYLHPMGMLLMEGFSRYGNYFKDAIDKLKVSVHVFKVGKFKSAVEPFIRNDMSPEAKLANEAWINELWKLYKEDVASVRGFSQDNFDETFAQLIAKFTEADGDFGVYALENGWVDGLRTRAQFKDEMIELLGEGDTDNTFNSISYDAYLDMVKPPFPMQVPRGDNQVAVIVAKGTILDGVQEPGSIGGDSTAKLLRKARNNDKVKAVVLQVDSGGGSAFASEVIRQEVLLLKEAGKPVIASMSSVAASGGYWISASADKIFAEPTTITGSIGIFGVFNTVENTLDYVGIHTDGVSSNELNGISPDRPLEEGYKTIIQMSIERGYDRFISLVAEERDMTLEQVDEIAQGRVWVGTQALKLGLVDELGGLEEAVAAAAKMAELEDYKQVYIEKELTDDQKMWANLLQNASVLTDGLEIKSKPSPLMKMIETVEQKTKLFEQLNDPMNTYVLCIECQTVND